VHDGLFARVLYAEPEEGPLLVVSLDHMGLTPGQSAALKWRLTKGCGVAANRVLLFYSHTHAGAEFRAAGLAALIGQAAADARRGARRAQVAYLRADVGRRYSVNRRAVVGRGLGAVSIIFNRNVRVNLDKCTEECGEQIRDFIRTGRNVWSPLYLQPEADPPAEPALSRKQRALLAELPPRVYLDGPVDADLEWLCYRTPRGRWLGSIIRSSAHPVMWRKSITKSISADYPGVFAAAIESATGAPAVFVNGPCGDVKPLYTVNSGAEMKRVGQSVAEELLSRRRELQWSALRHIGLLRTKVRFPVHRDVREYAGRWPIEEAARRHAIVARQKRDPVATKTALDWALRVWGNGSIDWRRPSIALPFSLATFNDVGLLGLPTEVWCEIGLDIKRICRDRRLIVGANCDVATNYVPVPGALALGGYEAANSMLEESAGRGFIRAATALVSNGM
jgi:hypothetical protein